MSIMFELPLDRAPAASTAVAMDLNPVLAGALQGLLQRQGGLLAVKELPSGRYVHVNDAMAALLRRDAADVLGRTDQDLFDAATATALRAAEHTALAQEQPLSSHHSLEIGGVRREFSVLRLVTDADGAGRRWLCSVWADQGAELRREAQLRLALEQIEQQQRANDQLRRQLQDQALRDPASGLYQRAHFDDQLRREVDLSMREHREFAVVIIEIDPPAPRVLALGSAGEQRVLEALGSLLRSGTRAMDASCRYDERRFAVLLSGVGLATAHTRMEGLRRKCANQIVVHDGQELGFTVAMGVASFPHTAQSLDALRAACDGALEQSRRRGGNQVTLAAIPFEPVAAAA